MPTLTIVNRAGDERVVEGTPGISVMRNIREHGFDELMALCGGDCSCATCHVYVDPAFADLLPPISEDEEDLLDTADHRTPQWRLSCQVRFSDALDGIKVMIAPED